MMLLLGLLGGLLLVSLETVVLFRKIFTQRENHLLHTTHKHTNSVQRKFALLHIHSYSGLFVSIGLTTALTAMLVVFTWGFESIEDLEASVMPTAEVDVTSTTQNVSSVDNSYRKKETDKPFIVVEQPAEFEGGIEKFYAYVCKQLNYPRQARHANVQGKAFFQFELKELAMAVMKRQFEC